MFENCKPGDMLTVHTADSLLSWAVMYYTGPTIWSHSAIFEKDGYLYDCTTQGVKNHHISEYFDGKSYVVVQSLPNESKKQQFKMILRVEQLLGLGFDWKGIFFFWLRIVSGNYIDFRFSIVADVIILLGSLMLLFSKNIFLKYAFFSSCVLYLLVVIFSRIRVKLFETEEELVELEDEPEDEYVVGKNIVDDLINLSLDELEKYFIPFEKDFSVVPSIIIEAYNNMASMLAKVEEYDKAEMLYHKAIKYCDVSTNDGRLINAITLNDLAGVYFEKKDFCRTIETMEAAEKLIEGNDSVKTRDLYAIMQSNLKLFESRMKSKT